RTRWYKYTLIFHYISGRGRDQYRRLPTADPSSILNNGTLLDLPKDVRQAHNWEAFRLEHIKKHLTWTHRRELITVAHQDEPGLRTECSQRGVSQKYVEHADLIDDKHVGLQRMVLIVEEVIAWLSTEQSMQGLGLE